MLGEEERGQSQYQVLCFVTKFTKSDFISTDAMAKLRQVSQIIVNECDFNCFYENNFQHYVCINDYHDCHLINCSFIIQQNLPKHFHRKIQARYDNQKKIEDVKIIQ